MGIIDKLLRFNLRNFQLWVLKYRTGIILGIIAGFFLSTYFSTITDFEHIILTYNDEWYGVPASLVFGLIGGLIQNYKRW